MENTVEEAAGQPVRRRRSASDIQVFSIVHRSLGSIKAEIARGTPVDPLLIQDIETRLAEAENETY